MNDSGAALREGVEHALGGLLDVDWWRTHEDAGLDTRLWATIEDLGLPRLLTEGQATLAEAHGAIQALASLPVPAPAAETLVAHWLASRAGLTLPDGPITLGPVHDEPLPAIVHNHEGWVLTGRLHDVPWGFDAKAILLRASAEDGDRWCVVTDHAAGSEARTALSGEARAIINLHGVVLDDANVARVDDPLLLWRAGAALRSVQMAAALGAALDFCTTYTTERVQFGRPLAKFQAIQQQLAVLAALATQTQVAARYAFVRMDAEDAQFAVAAAKSSTGLAATEGVAIAHQTHGAMGFTAEYGLHRVTRRIWTWREEFGNEAWWNERLGSRVAGAGADALWPTLAAS